MRIGMTQEEFFSDDAHSTTFVNRIAAFLKIPFDRIRIVGIVDVDLSTPQSSVKPPTSGRRILSEDGGDGAEIQFVILGDAPSTAEKGYKPDEHYEEL